MRSQKNTTPINIEDIQSLDEVCKMKDDLESLKASVIRQMDSIKANENSFLMQKPYTSYSQKRQNSSECDSLEEGLNYMRQLSQNIELL